MLGATISKRHFGVYFSLPENQSYEIQTVNERTKLWFCACSLLTYSHLLYLSIDRPMHHYIQQTVSKNMCIVLYYQHH